MDCQIDRARLEHIQVLTHLFDGYRQFYGQPSDLGLAERFLSERLEQGDSVIYIAFEDDRGLGFVQLYPSFSSVSAERLWILNDLYVSPPVRRQGVGEALMMRARDHAADTGAKGLVLSTQVRNKAAQSLYERLGYRRDTEFYQYFLPTPR